MGELIDKCPASVFRNGNGTLTVILHSPAFKQMRVEDAKLFFGNYDPELNIILGPNPLVEDSFADQVVKEVEDFEQFKLWI